MARYFLHVRDGDNRAEDLDGSECATLSAAESEAIAGAREMLAESLMRGEALGAQQIEICDGMGAIVKTVRFRDAFRLR